MLKCTRKQQADEEIALGYSRSGPAPNPFVFLSLSTPLMSHPVPGTWLLGSGPPASLSVTIT